MTKLIAIAAVVGSSLGGGIYGVTAATKAAPTCCANPCAACADGCDLCDLCAGGDCALCCGSAPAATATTTCCAAKPAAATASCCATPCADCGASCDGCPLCEVDCAACCGVK